jgi:alkanesulfonate monooxygenase SsuD/methylene tetrahydromethanopterin reductase-like flavin-dependent oxidoreductase (luciferase family)
MRAGVSIPPFTDAATLVALGVEAERAGWDGVFFWDHVVWEPESRHDVHDPWVLLGAVAAGTERVRLGTLVTPLARRRPWVVAKHVTTLDHLSHGRAVLGVGLGEPPDADFADFGDPGDPVHRGALLDEGLTLLDGLFRGRWSTGASATPSATSSGRGRRSGWRRWRPDSGRWRGRGGGTGWCRSGTRGR